MKILIISDPELDIPETWVKMLKNVNAEVTHIQTITPDLYKLRPNNFDLVVPLSTTSDFIDRSTKRFNFTMHLEKTDFHLLNSVKAIKIAADKWTTYKNWLEAGIPQPKTLELHKNSKWQAGVKEMIIKPKCGHRGEGIELVESIQQAKKIAKNYIGGAILQEYIPDSKCIRIICTTHQILSCYEKYQPRKVVKNISNGAKRKHFVPNRDLSELAKKMMQSLDSNLAGIDILEKDHRYFAIEANIAFGFNPKDVHIKKKLISVVNDFCKDSNNFTM